jgi:methylated-DNA-[protein]-cysteine S-methyltransferase
MPSSTFWSELSTPLQTMVLACTGAGLHGAWFVGQRHFDGPAPDWQRDDQHPLLQEAAAQLTDWYAGRRRDFALPLAPAGTPFQRAVWAELARIAPGTTRTYGEVAAALGRPTASRAVGAATGRNPLSIFIPCHRLVGRDSALTGYAGGLDRKRTLLAFEAGVPGVPLEAA